MMSKYDLERFIKVQNGGGYDLALKEIKAGKKCSHWIWYIFPQLKGLGFSYKSQYYGIENIEEAREYLAHSVLGARLIEISEALLNLQESDPFIVMGGSPDDMKLQSCMTLFASVSENGSVFHRVLEKFFDGKMDSKTIKLLSGK
ncbi:MAG: DUF1810 domain-containing protein [Synergistaceae bacterium]|nr:DUF1810 domain-containing protein [Synergistaceae bacterium]